MRPIMTYKPYSVVVVPFPFTDSFETKKRPAVVISKDTFQKRTGHVCLLMITSAKNNSWYGDHDILDLQSCGLHTPSTIRQKAFTVDVRLIQKRIGTLSLKDQLAVKQSLNHNLDL